MDVKKIDVNLNVPLSISYEGYTFRSALEPPISLHGVYHDGEGFRRLPKEVAEMANPGVVTLAKNTSGGRVRFMTDSKRIAIRAKMPNITAMPHMAFVGIRGFDMYVGCGEDCRFEKAFIPRTDMIDGYEAQHIFPDTKMRLITINFPLYNDLSSLDIGIDSDATIAPAPRYTYDAPIVFYGSSVTQGGCASRPGAAYTALISRALDADFINLGFSGSGRGEICVAEYIASLKMSAFVLDYDYNAKTPDDLLKTHKPFFDAVRRKNPKLPIIMISRTRAHLIDEEIRRRDIILESYRAARAAGDENVYFISGEDIASPLMGEGFVDGVHPTDLGFYFMAKEILPVLKAALSGGAS